MKFIKQEPKLITAWHRWFAWYPVRVSDQCVVWLEVVERKLWEARTWAESDKWLFREHIPNRPPERSNNDWCF